ncbi:MAG: hypothetical protein LUC83_02595 [Clostridiales bacterium]|nr:hypothetical protein [Clostridiales bacterium]
MGRRNTKTWADEEYEKERQRQSKLRGGNVKKKRLEKFLQNSFINYLSDLFIAVAVIFWIVDNVYESIIASIVTLSSVKLSAEVGYACYDTSMWSSIGTNVAIPLATGGSVWLIKCAVQHAIANNKGKQAHMDFPRVDVEDIEPEPMMFEDDEEEVKTESQSEDNPEEGGSEEAE